MRGVVVGACAVAALPAAASAAGEPFWSVGAGRSGFRDAPVAGLFSAAYHHDPLTRGVRPTAGVLASGDGHTFYFGGLSFDLEFPTGLGAMPLLTAGYYARGSGMNLGGVFEFRSGIEIYHRVGRSARVGVSVHHISNAGLYDRNPGLETVFVSFGVRR
jgi:hypothetical protein